MDFNRTESYKYHVTVEIDKLHQQVVKASTQTDTSSLPCRYWFSETVTFSIRFFEQDPNHNCAGDRPKADTYRTLDAVELWMLRDSSRQLYVAHVKN